MADALLSPAVGMAMNAISVSAIGVSAAKVNKDEFGEEKIPLMGVAGAMVFAAQMINFTIPATGSSGHIGGGILLAGLLGGVPAFLSISAVLIIQCLFFADGGLLALGCNIFNIGVIPCLLVYPLIFKPIMKGNKNYKRLTAASVASAVIALELGAFCVVLQTSLSGITELPFGIFIAFMLPVHLAIGFVEGAVTAAILCYVFKARPEIILSALSGKRAGGVPVKKAVIAIAALAVVTGGVLSLFASIKPDGLEWAIAKTESIASGADSGVAGGGVAGGGAETGTYSGGPGGGLDGGSGGVAGNDGGDSALRAGAAGVQEKTALLPGYAFASEPENAADASVSGIVGAAVTFVLAGAAGFAISKLKKKKRPRSDA